MRRGYKILNNLEQNSQNHHTVNIEKSAATTGKVLGELEMGIY